MPEPIGQKAAGPFVSAPMTAEPGAHQAPEQRESPDAETASRERGEAAERRADHQRQHCMDEHVSSLRERVRHRQAEAGPHRTHHHGAGTPRQPASRCPEEHPAAQHGPQQRESCPRVMPVGQEGHVERLVPVQPRGGEPVPVLIRGEEADQQNSREHGGHRPQGEHDAARGDVEGSSAFSRRAHSDGDRRRVDERNRKQVEQQGDRDPFRDEVAHRAPEPEARAEVRSLDEREAVDSMVLVEGEAGRRDVVEPAQVLQRRGLIEPVEAVVVVLQRLLRLRLEVLALDQGLGADASRRRRHDHEDHQGDPDEGREHQQDSPDEVGGHGEIRAGVSRGSRSCRDLLSRRSAAARSG